MISFPYNISNNHTYTTSRIIPEDLLKWLTTFLLMHKRGKIHFMGFRLLAFTPFKFHNTSTLSLFYIYTMFPKTDKKLEKEKASNK